MRASSAAATLLALSLPSYTLAQTAPARPAADEPISREQSEQPGEAEGRAENPLEVRVIGDKAESLQRVPGSGTVVGPEEVRRAQPEDVGEMLRRVPGVTVRQDAGGGNRFDLTIRGIDALRGRRVLLLEDGVPQAINPYGEPDVYYGPPIERVRSIEVVKGSGSILFGPQTIGGVINFLTIAPPPQREVSFEIVGGVPAYGKALARYGDATESGETRWVAQIFHERGEGLREDPFQATDFLGKVAFDTSARGQATVKISIHDEIVSSSPAGLTREMFIEDPRRPSLGPYDELRIKRYEAAVLHEHAFSENIKLRTLAFAYTTSRVWHNQRYERAATPGVQYERVLGDPSLPNGALFFEYGSTVPDRTHEVVGVEPRLERRFATGGIGHTLYAGTRLLGEWGERQQRRGELASSAAGALETHETSRGLAFAAFAQDKIAFREWLVATPGVRFEYAHFRRHIRRAFVDGAPRDVRVIGTSDMYEVIPGIGLIAGTRTDHAFAGAHIGFAPPRLATAIDDQGVDEQLEAERSIAYEVGARTAPARGIKLEAAGFAMSFSNQVIPAPAGRQGALVNAGATRHLGVESSLTVGIGEAMRWPTALDLGGRYTLSRATFVGGASDGNALPYAPLHTASAFVDAQHPVGLGGQIAWSYQGDQFTDDANTLLEDTGARVGLIEAYQAIDVSARYRHARSGITVGASVKNVLDDIHVLARRPDGIFPGGFRRFFLSLRWDWVDKR